jgi:hypothetical protein
MRGFLFPVWCSVRDRAAVNGPAGHGWNGPARLRTYPQISGFRRVGGAPGGAVRWRDWPVRRRTGALRRRSQCRRRNHACTCSPSWRGRAGRPTRHVRPADTDSVPDGDAVVAEVVRVIKGVPVSRQARASAVGNRSVPKRRTPARPGRDPLVPGGRTPSNRSPSTGTHRPRLLFSAVREARHRSFVASTSAQRRSPRRNDDLAAYRHRPSRGGSAAAVAPHRWLGRSSSRFSAPPRFGIQLANHAATPKAERRYLR